MDTGNGHFKMLDRLEAERETQKGTEVFNVGQTVEIRGSRFRIKKITPKGLSLRLLPKK